MVNTMKQNSGKVHAGGDHEEVAVYPYPYCDPDTLLGYKFNTLAIKAGNEFDRNTKALIPPLFLSSTYVQSEPGENIGYDYTRAGNPNFSLAEQQIAALENGKYGVIFSSGLAAISALLADMKAGDKVLCYRSSYGGTYRLLTKIFENLGVVTIFKNVGDYKSIEECFIEDKPRMFLFETPTNPLLEVTDIEKVTSLAKRHDVLVAVDNTFATPYHQKPLDLGADIVVHSATKYLGGHSDVVLGVLITNNAELHEKFDFKRKCIGLNPSPFDCWLLRRSVKTLGLRMKQQSKNSLEIATYLSKHPFVSKVYYNGLKQNEFHELANKQLVNGYGGIVSAEFRFTDVDEAKLFIRNLKIFHLAESLGGVHSLICQPATMTHASIPAEYRKEIGLADGLLRFSVGIEDVVDQINDIQNSIDAVIAARE